ncbi:sulfur carrier protein ThiS [Bacillus marasmi]|uniref:sulfur carrier protein ThiS n=1 Tax=Bacillus marasmi TaxID=1926279 RepID=UPI0011C74DAF|nr:sulfur carrier protein ThiS [Bacillus marasmi]
MTVLIKKVQLNGEIVELPEDVESVWDLLKFYELENRIVVVEVNKDITVKENYKHTPVVAGDVIEIIHFVGGG